MAQRLTNAELHTDIKVVQKDMEYLKEGQTKMQSDISMIKQTLLDPNKGIISKVNRNTSFRNKANKALWSIWIVVLGVIAKLIFWN